MSIFLYSYLLDRITLGCFSVFFILPHLARVIVLPSVHMFKRCNRIVKVTSSSFFFLRLIWSKRFKRRFDFQHWESIPDAMNRTGKCNKYLCETKRAMIGNCWWHFHSATCSHFSSSFFLQHKSSFQVVHRKGREREKERRRVFMIDTHSF